jgi:phage terminase large subunit GpA-like protein
VPCPHCKDRFEFKFEQLNFHRDECRNDRGVWNLDKVREITSLTCPCCKQDIKQKQQTKMVHDGIWVQTNHEAPKRHISWHISALYSPTSSWGQIAVLFLQKKDTPGGLHDFYNHYLGLPFTREATSVTITDIENVVKASPSYHLFNIKSADKYVLPCQAEFIVMGVDVQQDTFWWGQRALDLSESSYLIDYGQASSWDDLTELRERYYTQPDGTKIQVWKAFIDSGYRATRQSGVYNHCIKSGGYFIPCQGRSMVHGLFQPIRETEFEYRDYLIPAVQLRDDLYKEQLYIQKIKERAGSPWWLPQNLDEAYKKQLTDEKLEVKRNERGTDVMEWVTKGNNHLGDVEKYILGGIDLVVPYVRAKRNGTLVKANDEKGEFYQVLETLKEERKEEQLVIDPFANTW